MSDLNNDAPNQDLSYIYEGLDAQQFERASGVVLNRAIKLLAANNTYMGTELDGRERSVTSSTATTSLRAVRKYVLTAANAVGTLPVSAEEGETIRVVWTNANLTTATITLEGTPIISARNPNMEHLVVFSGGTWVVGNSHNLGTGATLDFGTAVQELMQIGRGGFMTKVIPVIASLNNSTATILSDGFNGETTLDIRNTQVVRFTGGTATGGPTSETTASYVVLIIAITASLSVQIAVEQLTTNSNIYWRLFSGSGAWQRIGSVGAAGRNVRDNTAQDTKFLTKSDNLSSVTSASTSFTNIKQTATTASTGVVEEATQAEMTAGTNSKFPDAATVKVFVDAKTVMVNNLTSTSTTASLTGAQGKVLKDQLDGTVTNWTSGALGGNFTGANPGVVYAQKVGNMVTLTGSLSGTSLSTPETGNILPAAFRPALGGRSGYGISATVDRSVRVLAGSGIIKFSYFTKTGAASAQSITNNFSITYRAA